jgi:hypothetical protein
MHITTVTSIELGFKTLGETAKKIKVKEIRMRDKSRKACQFVSLLIRFACVAILFLVTSAIPTTTTRVKRIVLIGFSAMVLLSTGSGQSHGQTRSPSFQYVATAGGEQRDLSKPIAPLPMGERAGQTVRMSPAHRVNQVTQKLGEYGYFSNPPRPTSRQRVCAVNLFLFSRH